MARRRWVGKYLDQYNITFTLTQIGLNGTLNDVVNNI